MSNRLLQQRVREVGKQNALPVFIPPRECEIGLFITSRLCTDNAIMIAWRGQQLIDQNRSIVPFDRIMDIRYNDRLDFLSLDVYLHTTKIVPICVSTLLFKRLYRLDTMSWNDVSLFFPCL